MRLSTQSGNVPFVAVAIVRASVRRRMARVAFSMAFPQARPPTMKSGGGKSVDSAEPVQASFSLDKALPRSRRPKVYNPRNRSSPRTGMRSAAGPLPVFLRPGVSEQWRRRPAHRNSASDNGQPQPRGTSAQASVGCRAQSAPALRWTNRRVGDAALAHGDEIRDQYYESGCQPCALPRAWRTSWPTPCMLAERKWRCTCTKSWAPCSGFRRRGLSPMQVLEAAVEAGVLVEEAGPYSFGLPLFHRHALAAHRVMTGTQGVQ